MRPAEARKEFVLMPQPTEEYKEKENYYRPGLDVFQSMLSWGLTSRFPFHWHYSRSSYPYLPWTSCNDALPWQWPSSPSRTTPPLQCILWLPPAGLPSRNVLVADLPQCSPMRQPRNCPPFKCGRPWSKWLSNTLISERKGSAFHPAWFPRWGQWPSLHRPQSTTS